jgi:hypothetical protein
VDLYHHQPTVALHAGEAVEAGLVPWPLSQRMDLHQWWIIYFMDIQTSDVDSTEASLNCNIISPLILAYLYVIVGCK